jgi:hypothetical protein
VHDIDPCGRKGHARVERGDGRVVPQGDLPEEDRREHRAGQVQPGTCWEGQVVDHAFAAQGDGHLRDRPALGGGLLAGGHRHVGGAEIDLSGAERGDARAAAHSGVADTHAGMLLLVPGEGHGEERRVERRPGTGEGGRVAAGAGRGGDGRRGVRAAGAGAGGGKQRDRGGGPDGWMW